MVKKVVKLMLVGMLIMGLMVSAVGCGGQAKEEPQTPADKQTQEQAQTEKKPVLLVGSETTYPPFEMANEKGEYVGFDMDLIKAIAAAEGYDVKVSTLGFDALIPALKADKVDCVISAMSIRPDRLESVDFSDPYFNAGLIVAVQKNTEGINSREDLKGKKLAAEVATTGLAASQEIKAKDPKTEIKIFDAVGEAFMELEKGGVDAVINDMPVTDYYIKTTGKDKVKMVGEVFSATDKYGIAVQKGDTKTLEIINSGLKKLKDSGDYDKIYKTWFEK
ncbi:MAG: basic amino acid ABC transporter substrate-binding protein [Syntrophomonadaceae bacterium]|nr:basic amino acid ABC transporter substrate-binding protein [Syntrophomonadaceae bacterium]